MACYCTVRLSGHHFVVLGSAAKRVFATPELLGQILLSTDDEDYVYKMSAAKRLFVLQRVDTTFANTRHGSCKLKYRMGLEYKPRESLETPFAHDSLSNILDFLMPMIDVSYHLDQDGVLNANLDFNLD